MKLFNKFTETIFYKNYNELDKQIGILRKLNAKYPNNEKISLKLKLAELGLQGEKQIEFELKNANIGMYVLHDINLCFEDLKAQIDYIIITPAYTYFVECKNLIGNIIVNDRGEFIREISYNGKKYKEGIYSPLWQAQRHLEVYKKIWQNRHGLLFKHLYGNSFDIWNKALVVLANPKNIIDVRKAPKEVKNKIIRSDYLVSHIKKDIANCNKDYLSTQKDMEKIAYTIMSNYHREVHKNYEAEFMKLIDETENNGIDKEAIKNKLIKFRVEKAKKRNIPAYYIFTDNELEKLLEYLPKTKEELASLNILPKVKLDLHGEEIINIINYTKNIV